MQTFGVKEAAEKLGMSAMNVYLLVKKQQIPHVRIGRKIRFTDDIIEEILSLHKVTAQREDA